MSIASSGLCDEGCWPHHGYRSTLPETLETFRDGLIDACRLRYPSGPIERTCEAVLTSFGHIATLGGYLAAESLASDGRRAPDLTLALWRRFVGEAWEPFMRSIDDFPSAAVPASCAALDALTLALMEPLEAGCTRWDSRFGTRARDCTSTCCGTRTRNAAVTGVDPCPVS